MTPIDKSKWPRGPWDSEPDRRFWRTRAGLHAYIIRQANYGHLCGYVEVPTEVNEDWNREQDDEKGPWTPDIDMHGGVTWSGETSQWAPEYRPEYNCWWWGFDCNHAWDYAPGLATILPRYAQHFADQEYKTFAYAEAECEKAARNLRDWQMRLTFAADNTD